jgi:SAM-dependent methyltransferase
MAMLNISLAILLFLSLLLFLWQLSNFISVIFGSPFVSAEKQTSQKAIKILNLKKGEVFYELGCGSGQVLLEANKYGVEAVGFEISPFYFALSTLRTLFCPRIKIYCRDIRKVDFSRADAMYCYLLPNFLEALAPKFKKELSNKARLVSVGFAVNGLKNKKTFKIGKHKFYYYSLNSRSA